MRELINIENWLENIEEAKKNYSFLEREMLIAIVNILYSNGEIKLYS